MQQLHIGIWITLELGSGGKKKLSRQNFRSI